MSLGLEALLEAAQFLEQQEKLKLSPQPAAPTITINEQRYFVQRPNANYENAMATATSTAAGVGHNNNTIVSGTGKNLKMRHFNAVSASAPAAGATFHHTNGLTITSCSSSNNNSQLIGATNRSNDYEYRNGNSVNVTGTTQQPGAATSCSRSSEGHLIEDQFSSNVVITNKKFTTSPKATSSKTTTNSTTSSSDSLMLTRIKSSEQSPQLQQLQQQQQHHQITTFATTVTQKPPQSLQPPQSQQPQQQQLQYSNNKNKSAADFTLAAGKSVVVSAAASKQMLLNGGVRVAAPAASIGIIVKSSSSSASAAIPPKTIASTPNQLLQQPQQQLSHTSPVLSASSSFSSSSFSSSSSHPIYTAPNSSAPHALNLHRHKKCNPLTPPPMPSKKFVETNTRIRSFSLSSNKFTVGTAAAANSTNSTTGSPNQQQHVLLQQASEDSHMSYVSGGGSSGASPPRHHHHHHHQLNGAGSHYIQMMSSAASGSSQAGPAAPLIGGSGRRRTISSNSNGAGTREVHNKLEKNRRAHLKECYEQLKNQLQLRDEDRKKTSNLAILGEAYKHVIALKRKDQELEAQVEQLAKEKINAQKKIVSLKRELGPKFEQYFASIIPDDLSSGSIPVERENLNDSSSLCSSGRGSLLYSSSSSLSSGGSSNSNTVSSPIGAGLPTALPAALSPVITQKITNSYSASSCVITTTTPTTATASATASPISPTVLLQQIKSETHSAESSPALGVQGSNSSQGQLSPVSSPTTSLSGVVNMPLSLTAKNISATSLTRGSPTPLTPSPSPSSSSGVSSSSSIMSSSPPSVNGVISGRNVTVNIPNGLKFQTTTAGHTQQHSGTHNTGAAATIRGPQAAAAAASGGPAAAMSSNNNNATAGAATTAATAKLNASTTAASVNTPQHAIGGRSNSQPRKTSFFFEANNRKISGDESFKSALQDGEQPAKLLKVFDNSSNNNNNNSSFVAMSPLTTPNSSPSHDAIQPPSAISKKLTAVGANSSRIANNCSDSSLVLCPTPTSTSTTTTTTANQVLASQQLQITKVIIKKGGSGSGGGGFMSHAAQLRRPSGSVAETNILPNHVAHLYGAETAAGNDAAATFFQTNGKLTLLNGGGDGSGCSNGTFLFKATTDHQHHSTLSLLNDVSNVVRLTPTPAPTVTAASLHFSSLAPLVAASAETTVPTAAPTPLSYFGNSGGNFAQLLAAAATAAAGNVAAPRATVERRRNSKVST